MLKRSELANRLRRNLYGCLVFGLLASLALLLPVASSGTRVELLLGTGIKGSELTPDDPTKTQLNRPAEVEMSPNGSLLLIDSGNHRVLRLARDGCSVDSVIGQKSPGILLYHDNPQLSFLNSPH